MWNMKCMIKPEISGATGIVTEGLKEHLEATSVEHSIDSLQKTAVLGTSHTHNTESAAMRNWKR
jgi:hypothetical protein